MYLSSSELKAAGIENVGRIEIYFHAYDSDWNYIFQNVYSEIQTSEYANMDTTPTDTGAELYNENGIKIVGKTVDNMSVNGFMMSPFFSTTVYDGKKSIDEITLFSSELEENGIEAIEEVELKFHIYDANSYSTITDTDPITFSAQ